MALPLSSSGIRLVSTLGSGSDTDPVKAGCSDNRGAPAELPAAPGEIPAAATVCVRSSGPAGRPPAHLVTESQAAIVTHAHPGAAARRRAAAQLYEPGDAIALARVGRKQVQHSGIVSSDARQ